MANGPFDRLIINPREKPLSSDINQAQSQLDRTFRFFMEQLFADAVTGNPKEGFVNNGMDVVEDSPQAMSVIVQKGIGFQIRGDLVASAVDGVVGLDDLSDYKPMVLLDNLTFSVPAAPAAPNTRIDIIEVQASYLTTDPSTRSILNTGTGAFDATSVNKILTWLLDARSGTVNAPSNSTLPLSYKVGVAGNPGVAPATTAGYIKLCEVNVGSDVTVITNADITDNRTTLVNLSDFVETAGDTMTGPLEISVVDDQADRLIDLVSTVEQTKHFMAVESNVGLGFTLDRVAGFPMIGSPFYMIESNWLDGVGQALGGAIPSTWTDWEDVSSVAVSGAFSSNLSGGGAGEQFISNAMTQSYGTGVAGDICRALWMGSNLSGGDDAIYVWEMPMAGRSGAGDAIVYMGITDSNGAWQDTIQASLGHFRWNLANNELRFRTSDAITHTDTVLTPKDATVDVWDMFRVEYFGANTPFGLRAKAYINNVLVAEHVGSGAIAPGGSGTQQFSCGTRISGGSPATMYFGPMRFGWLHTTDLQTKLQK